MTYQEYKEDYDKKYYTSMTAEYKRNSMAKYSFKLPTDRLKEVYEYVFHLFLKENKVDDIATSEMFIGMNIGTDKQPVFIEKLVNGEIFAFSFKRGKDFYDVEVSMKLSHGLVKCTVSRSVKRRETITGMNGTLAGMKFRSQHKKQGYALEKGIRNYFNLK